MVSVLMALFLEVEDTVSVRGFIFEAEAGLIILLGALFEFKFFQNI